MDTTEKLGLNLPEKGYEDWGVPLNENFETLDTAVGNLEEVIDTKVAALETRVNEEIGVAVEGLQGEVSNLSEQTAKLDENNTFTGINNVPTPAVGDNSTQIANTEWVLANAGIKISYEDE